MAIARGVGVPCQPYRRGPRNQIVVKHLPQRMGLGDKLLGADVGEQGTIPVLLAAHHLSAVGPFFRSWLDFSADS